MPVAGSEKKMERDVVRLTAEKVLRSDGLGADEKQAAAAILRANPEFGNPHVVRCDWCRETRMLFRDENVAPFVISEQGWLCEACDVRAADQEIRF